IQVRVARPPARPTVLTRLFTRRPKRLFISRALPSQDGRSIFLPSSLALNTGDQSLAHGYDLDSHSRLFRTFAIHQSQRCCRRAQAIDDTPHKNQLLALLVNVSEAFNAEYELLQAFPGLKSDLLLVRQLVRQR